MTRKSLAAVATGMAALVLTGCTMPSTTSSEVALQYGGGLTDSKTFVQCVPTGTKQTNDVSDTYEFLPQGQRDFTFNNNENADSPPLTAAVNDPSEITVSGTVKFSLPNCTEWTDKSGKKWPGGKLQMLHETILANYDAAPDEGGQTMRNPGWRNFLRNYIGASLDRGVDNESLKYGSLDLFSNEQKKAAWESDVLKQLPAILKTLTQGEDLITIDAVLLQKPSLAPKVLEGMTEKQASILRSQAVEIDKNAAASFPGGIVAYQAYQQQQALNQAIKEGKVPVIPVPMGSGLNLQIPPR